MPFVLCNILIKNKLCFLENLQNEIFYLSLFQGYIYCMIKTFKHKGLKLFWESGNTKQLPQDQIDKLRRILDTLNEIKQVPQDLVVYRNWGIHKLKGNYIEYWSLIVKDNWRIIFRFEEEMVYDVNLVDYH
jgi:proteic killer suppression protein